MRISFGHTLFLIQKHIVSNVESVFFKRNYAAHSKKLLS